ncbi:hypothetical protein PSEUDO9AG_10116 [Pseudomonas sp. 9Ag]|nr:hypothetical protein PSEUDO9AG_10116 [Pseudomonas sp. 9Ag]
MHLKWIPPSPRPGGCPAATFKRYGTRSAAERLCFSAGESGYGWQTKTSSISIGTAHMIPRHRSCWYCMA